MLVMSKERENYLVRGSKKKVLFLRPESRLM